MKENKEFEWDDLEINRDIQIDDNNPHLIIAVVEPWCKVNEKFDVRFYENSVLDIYAFYNPFDDTLKLDCVVDNSDENIENDRFDYEPTENEAEIIKKLIAEKIQEEYGQTPRAFCEDVLSQDEEVYVYRNTKDLSEKGLLKQRNTIKEYMASNGYENGGSISIARPMSRSEQHYHSMVDYCKAHGIMKIVVADIRDIGNNLNELFMVVNDLKSRNLSIEVVNSDISHAPKEDEEQEIVEEEPDESITMGGM